MLSVIGAEQNKTKIYNLKNCLVNAFKKHYVNEYCKVIPFTQTGQALAIDVGIFEGEEKEYAIAQLVWLIQSMGIKARVGVIGMRIIFNVLSENGYTDIAYKMAMSEEYPGFLYTKTALPFSMPVLVETCNPINIRL